MKNRVIATLFVLGLLAVAGNAHAQTMTFKAHVPFPFVVGNQTLPAGTYKFRSLLDSVPGKDTIDVLEVRSVEGHLYRAIVTDVIASEQSNHPRLVFTRSDSRVFPSEVWERGRQAGCQLQTHNEHTETAESENDKVILTASVDWP
jgi:hypothetical protein